MVEVEDREKNHVSEKILLMPERIINVKWEFGLCFFHKNAQAITSLLFFDRSIQ
jgi:hypothetical protein